MSLYIHLSPFYLAGLVLRSIVSCALISTFIRQKQAENNQQTDRQNEWTDSIDRQNDKPINYNTTKHLIKTENSQPHMQTFDKIKLNKMVINVYRETYYTKK